MNIWKICQSICFRKQCYTVLGVLRTHFFVCSRALKKDKIIFTLYCIKTNNSYNTIQRINFLKLWPSFSELPQKLSLSDLFSMNGLTWIHILLNCLFYMYTLSHQMGSKDKLCSFSSIHKKVDICILWRLLTIRNEIKAAPDLTRK